MNWGFSGTLFLTVTLGWTPIWLHLQPFFNLMPLILTLCVALAASFDLVVGIKRDWLHWTGTLSILANAGLIILWRLAI